MENINRDVGGYVMNYDEIQQLCRHSWEEEYNYLCIDRSKKGDQGRYFVCNGSRKTHRKCIPETDLLIHRNVVFN